MHSPDMNKKAISPMIRYFRAMTATKPESPSVFVQKDTPTLQNVNQEIHHVPSSYQNPRPSSANQRDPRSETCRVWTNQKRPGTDKPLWAWPMLIGQRVNNTGERFGFPAQMEHHRIIFICVTRYAIHDKSGCSRFIWEELNNMRPPSEACLIFRTWLLTHVHVTSV